VGGAILKIDMKRYLKTIVSLTIVTLTATAFAYYLAHHPETIRQLRHLPLPIVLGLVALYVVVFVAVALVTRASLHLYDKHMGLQENILFNAYSSLINFFGPGQSGPIFRGAYLKQRHSLSIKDYTFATLLYYAFYVVISVMFLLIGSRPWWQTAGLMALAAAASFAFIRWYQRRKGAGKHARFNPAVVAVIFAATIVQLAALALINGVELHNVGAHPSVSQVLAYTGVSNLTLFVALTPAGIGIRESFLLFSEHLHHINTSTIVAANLVDRGAYVVFLGMLFVLVMALHAKKKLLMSQLKEE
jgi:uncharacterized membrane protein YbhN (UPF0104 family)